MKQRVGLIMALCLLLFAGGGGGCAPADDEAGTHIDAGEALLEDNQHQKARAEFKRALAVDDTSIAAWSGLAEASLKRGDVKAATEAYQRILDIDPEHATARIKIARFDVLAGRLEPAEEKIRQVLSNHPDQVEALFVLADIKEKSGNMDQAVRIYQEIISQDELDNSRVVKALTKQARVQARSGELDQAEISLIKAAALETGTLEPRLMLFNLYLARQKLEKAEEVITEMVDAHPGDQRLRLLLGKFYFQQGRTEKAEAAFLQSTRIGQRDLLPWILAGKYYDAVNQPDEALEMYETARSLEPHNTRVLTTLAEFHLKRENNREARAILDELLDHNPGYFPARLLKVRQAISAGNFDRALELCQRYLKGNPASKDLLTLKGVAYLGQEEFQKAEDSLKEAIRVSPEDIYARVNLARVYLQQDKTEAVDQVNREILALITKHSGMAVILGDKNLHLQTVKESLQSPDDLSRFVAANPFGRMRLESLEKLTQQYDYLMQSLEALLADNPSLINVFESMVLLHAIRGEYDLALEKCDRQIEKIQDHPDMVAEVYNVRGGLLLARGAVDQAVDAYQNAIDLAPDFLQPYYGLAKCYIVNKDLDNAIGQYLAILARRPDQAGPHLMLGILYKLRENLSAAEKHYRRALEINPDLTQAANNLAYLLAENGRELDKALNLALEVKSRHPDDPYTRDTLGWVYYQKGLYEEAVRELSFSAQELPDNATAHYHLGMAWYQRGDFKQARKYLKRALEIDGSFSHASQAGKILEKIEKD
ncbi:MAG: tetratricopeptide repeat protein [Desulfosudaceae bacterium]